MEPTERKSKALKLVAGDNDEKLLAVRKHCKALLDELQCFTNGAEKALKTGMLVQWKPGMKNRNSPEYGEPRIVVELLEQPVLCTKFDSGSVYFREPLDLLLGSLDEEDEFCVLHYDSRRFETYNDPGMETTKEEARQ